MNGPWYWRWGWIRLDGRSLYPAMMLAGVPFLLAQRVYERDRNRAPFAVGLLMLSTLALELTAAGFHRRPFDIAGIGDAIRDPIATSYFSDARDLRARGVSVREALATHAERMPSYRTHTRFKPPGLLLFHMAFVALLGPTAFAALVAGLVLAALATVSVAATFVLIRSLCLDQGAAFYGASFMALSPSLILFVPQFDQVYPVMACALAIVWTAALVERRAAWAVAFGVLIAAACFASQMFLVLGLFLAGLTARHVVHDRSALATAARYALLAMVTGGLFYLALWLVTGYDPIGTYRTASRLLAGYSVRAQRPYPVHVVFDLLDFALGSGWISVVLVAFFLLDGSRGSTSSRQVAYLALGQVLVTAVLGLVPAETARTWTLMQPLVMVPVGLELAAWRPGARAAVFGGLWFVLVTLAQNMKFVIPARI